MTALRNALAEIDEDILLADGFDDAFVGYAERCTQGPVAVYDREKCIEILMTGTGAGLIVKGGMTWEEAEEFFEFNVIGAWVGDRTPLFLTKVER